MRDCLGICSSATHPEERILRRIQYHRKFALMATVSTHAATFPPPTTRVGYVILIAAAAALGGFLFGFDTAVINGAVLALKSEFNTTSVGIGLSVSLALVGSAVGAFFAGPLADRFGCVRCMFIAAILFTISAIGSGAPIGIADFIFWRILGGIGVGVASVIAPAYIAEVSPAEIRGRLGSLQQLAIVIGIFVALLGDFALADAAGAAMRAKPGRRSCRRSRRRDRRTGRSGRICCRF